MRYTMPPLRLAVALLALSLGACTSIERSRNLADPNVSGRTIAEQVCSTCHGHDGNSTSPQFPKLAGQQAEYLTAQLKGFRGHIRLDPGAPEYMWGLSRSLTQAQIEGLAAYFATQRPMSANAADPSLAAAGAELFARGLPEKEVPPCQVCHGASAAGLSGFPRLAGQHAPYLVRQMEVFQKTNNRPNTPMTDITHALTPEQMNQLAAYLSSLSTP